MTTSLVTTRAATPDDVEAVVAMHARCSATTLRRRFHVPVSSVPDSLVRRLISPPDGWSRLAEQGGDVVGLACAGRLSPVEIEVGLVVEDRLQGRGVGARLLRELAGDALDHGYTDLVCVAERDNAALLPTVRRAGLTPIATHTDGIVEVTVPLVPVDDGLPRPA